MSKSSGSKKWKEKYEVLESLMEKRASGRNIHWKDKRAFMGERSYEKEHLREKDQYEEAAILEKSSERKEQSG